MTLISDKLQEMQQAGCTLMVVEQNAAKALAVADRGYVLELGRNRFEGAGKPSSMTLRSSASTSEVSFGLFSSPLFPCQTLQAPPRQFRPVLDL